MDPKGEMGSTKPIVEPDDCSKKKISILLNRNLFFELNPVYLNVITYQTD